MQLQKIEGQLKVYSDTDREIGKACGELARFGIAGRNLRILRTSADREGNSRWSRIRPALRPLHHACRREAIENLETLAASTSSLIHMLLVRDLRTLTGEE